MNMISTGAFQTEMDASNKQSTLAEKFAAVWEKKNAKAARAGGVSLMALSLAACGSDDSTTTTTTDTTTTDTTTETTTETTTVTTPVVDAAKTIALTTSLDAAAGGSGDDSISASLISSVASSATVYTATTSTLNAGDSIDGGAGSDTLTITASGNIDANADVPGAIITNVETINVRAVTSPAAGGDNTTFNAINTTGVTALNATNSTDSVTFTNAPAAASIGMSGNNALTLGDVNFAYATATTAPVINISGGVKADAGTDITNTANGAASATINSTGEKNAVDVVTLSGSASISAVTINATTNLTIGAADATVGLANAAFAADATVTVTGAGAVDLNTIGTAVKTIDASASTGGVTAILGAVADVFTGGAGNDDVTLAAGAQTGAVAGGDGTDTIALGDSDNYDVASEVTKISGFETLRIVDVGNAAEDYQVNLLSGITKIEVGVSNNGGDDNILNKLNATQAANVHVVGDQAGDLDLVLTTATGTSDVATVTLGSGLTTTEAYDIAGDLNVTGFETLNLVSNPGVSVTAAADKVASVGTLTSADVTAVNMTGASITLSNAALTKAVTYDGSALTGLLNVAGTLIAGSTVKGSAGKDVFTVGGAGSTYIGNASDDTFNVAAVTSLENAGVFTTLTGGDGTKDSLVMTANAAHTIVDSNFKNITGLELFTADTDAGTNNFTMNVGGYFASSYATGVTADIDLGDHAAAAVFNASTYDQAVTLDFNSSVADTDITITTGGGADTITVTMDAATTSLLTVSTGAGNDTITVTVRDNANVDLSTDNMEITGGAGQDTIDVSGIRDAESPHVDINIAAGDSTLTAFDIINNYEDNGTTIGNLIDFAGSADHATAVTNNAVTGYTTAELLVTSTATGLVTFSGTSAASLTAAEKALAVQKVFTAANDTVVYTHGDDSFVFHNATAGDSLVQFTNYLAVGVDTTATTDQQIAIA